MLNKPVVNKSEEESQSATDINTNHTVRTLPPSAITDVLVHVGDEVKTGGTAVVLKAMKMANNIEAEKGGRMIAICIKQSESIMENIPLVMIE